MRKRGLLGLGFPMAFGALLLAACGGGSNNNASGGGGMGGMKGMKTYAIGCQGPLSGDYAQLGINICNGAKLAVDQANKSGNLPFMLSFKTADDQGSGTNAPTAARSLIDDSSVVAVVGPAFSGATQAAEPLFAQAGLASVSASATLPTLTDPKNGFTTFFRIVATDSDQGKGATAYLTKKLNVKKVYSINDKSAYGAGLATVLDKNLKDAGVTLKSEGVQPTKDYSAVAQKVVNFSPDAVYYSGYYADFALLVKALKSAGYTGTIVSDDGSKDPQFVKQAGTQAAEGVLFTCPCTDAASDPNAQQFVSGYKQAFNTDPSTYSPEAYDAANTIIAAMKSINGSIDRQKVVDAIKNVNYQGLTKQISFNSNGQVQANQIFLYQVKNGQIVFLGPVDKVVGSG